MMDIHWVSNCPRKFNEKNELDPAEQNEILKIYFLQELNFS